MDSDRSVHEFVRQAFEKHAPGWTLDAWLDPDSALRDLGCLEPPPAKPAEPPCPNAKHARGTPDVLLFETQWPDLSGFERLRTVATRLPESVVVAFTANSEDTAIIESLAAGALGYVIKPVAPSCLLCAINRVVQGQPFLCSQAQGALVRLLRRTAAGNGCQKLTWREREVMLGALDGAPNKELAARLGIKASTLHKHFDTIYRKLHVNSKDEARRKFVAGMKSSPDGPA